MTSSLQGAGRAAWIQNLCLRAVLFGEGRLCGGPFDGTVLKVSRLAPLGLVIPKWPIVYRFSDGRRELLPNLTDKKEFDVSWGEDSAWEGTYDWRFAADRYVWDGTGTETRSEVYAAIEARYGVALASVSLTDKET